MKIDVEGAEIEVLKGASKLLSKFKPILYCEVGDNQKDEVTNILNRAGYNFYDGNVPREKRSKLTCCAFNTLAYPIQ